MQQYDITSAPLVRPRDLSDQQYVVYDLALSRRMVTVKSFRVTNRVEWLNGEQTTVLRPISVLILRVVI